MTGRSQIGQHAKKNSKYFSGRVKQQK